MFFNIFFSLTYYLTAVKSICHIWSYLKYNTRTKTNYNDVSWWCSALCFQQYLSNLHFSLLEIPKTPIFINKTKGNSHISLYQFFSVCVLVHMSHKHKYSHGLSSSFQCHQALNIILKSSFSKPPIIPLTMCASWHTTPFKAITLNLTL